jgi:solute carrier family 5 (high affinity choline transporter), member 7
MAIAAVLALYVVFLAIGVAGARKAAGGGWADLLVAGRAMPLWLAVLTMTATWVDGGYLLGTVEGTFKAGVPLGAQGGMCFGLSLILGGLFFARRMRHFGFTTLIDPFEARFGRRWALVLSVPALLGEIFWSAELLVAIGSTFGVMLGIPLAWAIAMSAIVVTLYTVLGGMWSVAYTDAFQLGLVALGLLVALPVVFHAVGGLGSAWSAYTAARPAGASVLPPFAGGRWGWTPASIVNWWDVTLMLVLGGIPWNCYFQRVLSCRTPAKAQWHSILAGLLTIGFTVPPLLIGIAAFAHRWPAPQAAQLAAQPAETLPMVLQFLTPGWIAILGLGAIIGAVTSSFSASILSAGSMVAWNGVYRLWRPDLSPRQLGRLIRLVIVVLGAAALVLALKVQSVQALWFFTSDLVFVLLFPQLVFALFDRRVNRIGSVAAFTLSLALRLGGGEPLFGVAPTIPYPEIFASLLPGTPASWYDAGGALLFPYKSLAAAAGIVVLPLVSRLTARWDPPRALRNVHADQEASVAMKPAE